MYDKNVLKINKVSYPWFYWKRKFTATGYYKYKWISERLSI